MGHSVCPKILCPFTVAGFGGVIINITHFPSTPHSYPKMPHRTPLSEPEFPEL